MLDSPTSPREPHNCPSESLQEKSVITIMREAIHCGIFPFGGMFIIREGVMSDDEINIQDSIKVMPVKECFIAKET